MVKELNLMGYLQQGKVNAFFVRLDDAEDNEVMRLVTIFERTKNKRIKTKIAKRIDAMVRC